MIDPDPHPNAPVARVETWIVSVVALFTATAAYVMDWNATHIYNPLWPPHAKFHNGQTMSMGLLLGLLALWFVWRRPGDGARFRIALIFAALYWVTQASAVLYPGTATIDPEFKATMAWEVAGVPIQLLVDATMLALLGTALALRVRREAA